MLPEVSCLICVHSTSERNDDLLQGALWSIRDQISQVKEIVIVVDACWPNTMKAIQEWRDSIEYRFKVPIITLERSTKNGLADAKMAGLDLCSSEYIAFQDADDRSDPNRLKLQREFLADNPDVDVLACETWDIHPNGDVTPNCFKIGQYMTDEQIKARLPYENCIAHSSVVIKKQSLIDIGGYKDVRGFEDWELWRRLANGGYKFFKLPCRLFYTRLGSSVER